MTWAQLGRHNKPVVMFDQLGFWRPLLSLIEHMRAHGFIRHGLEIGYHVAEKVEDILPILRAAAQHAPDHSDPRAIDISAL
jgi:predicted Rossmann-fold nucleotide-binding protein